MPEKVLEVDILGMLDLVYENRTGDTSWSEDFFRRLINSACVHLNLDNRTVEVDFIW